MLLASSANNYEFRLCSARDSDKCDCISNTKKMLCCICEIIEMGFSMQASMIWIIGEYAERIDNADELLESFLETFPEEPAQVQLQLLTAAVKLFLKKPTEGPQQMIQVMCIFTLLAKLELPCTLLKVDRSIYLNADSTSSVPFLSSFDVGYALTVGYK